MLRGGGVIDSIYRDYHAAGGSLTVSTETTMLPGSGSLTEYRDYHAAGGGGAH